MAFQSGKAVFVTVGTTRFDDMIRAVATPGVAKALSALGYTRVVAQIGAGTFEPPPSVDGVPDLLYSFYRYKDSLHADVTRADLVISHAGAGSILEALRARRPLVVVVNEGLMDNHQLELARKLAFDGHLIYATCSTLGDKLAGARFDALRPLEDGSVARFGALVDSAMGY